MNQHYNIADHGDLLEQEGISFIREKFPNYELVWQTYIGNDGSANIAPLPNYPDPSKRISFAQHSYSTFESAFLIQHLLDSGVFMAEITTAGDYIRLNHAFISFFAYLGRIHDTVLKAAQDLGYDYRSFGTNLRQFYEARNIVLHGRKVPILLDQDGLVRIPTLQTAYTKGRAWNDKKNSWTDAAEMSSEFITDTVESYFNALMVIVNAEYGHFYDIIIKELTGIPTQLEFDRSGEGLSSFLFIDTSGSPLPAASGSTLAH